MSIVLGFSICIVLYLIGCLSFLVRLNTLSPESLHVMIVKGARDSSMEAEKVISFSPKRDKDLKNIIFHNDRLPCLKFPFAIHDGTQNAYSRPKYYREPIITVLLLCGQECEIYQCHGFKALFKFNGESHDV